MKYKDSLSYSQKPVIGLYPEADKYSAIIVVLPSNLHVSLPSGLFFTGSPTNALYLFRYFVSVPHVSPITSLLI